MTDNYIKEYQDRCEHKWIHTSDDMGYSVDICNECGAWNHYDKTLDVKQWSPSQEFGYDGDFYRCEHGRAYGIRCSECDKKS